MAQLGAARREAFGQAQRAQHFAANYAGLNAAERHKRFLNDYLKYYARGDASLLQQAPAGPTRTEFDALRDNHRFIRTEKDDADADTSWEARLAKKYYDRLFKEYCIGDLSRYKESKLGLRWRTDKEVISGKGQFVCGAKGCEVTEGLCSYEVNFAYVEAGERKQALVKLRVCPSCAFKLNYKKEKQLAKAQDRKRKRQQEEEAEEAGRGPAADPRVREALAFVQRYQAGGGLTEEEEAMARAARDVAPPPAAAAGAGSSGAQAGSGAAAGGSTGAAGAGVGGAAPTIITLPADNSVWEAKPQQEATAEDEFEQYFEGMFL